MSWIERLFSQRSSSTSASSPALAVVTIDGAEFPLAIMPEAFCALIAKGGRGVLRLQTPQYGALLGQLMGALEERHGRDSREVSELFRSLLFCAGCMWQFPPSYLVSLQGMGQVMPMMIGATPGADRFARTGACTQCGTTESLLVYDSVAIDDITMADVEAIRDYWRESSVQWWTRQSRSSGICDRCNDDIARGDGYLASSDLICERCLQRGLMTDGLAQLQRDPSYYGNGLLRKARAFRR